MDPYFRECRKEVYFASTPTATVGKEIPVSPQKFQAIFNICCQHKYRDWVLRQDSTELEFLRDFEKPLVNKAIHYDTNKTILSKDKLQRRLFGAFSDLSMPSPQSYKLSKDVSEVAWKGSTEGRGVNLKIALNLVVLHTHILDENRAIHLAARQSMQQQLMVPATDASIESLKSCQVMDCSGESCRICLEDFEAAANCQRVAMPCSHVFHQDCIKTWLKTSHYCPICRYQMPTK